jgi:hypothetical protein
VIAYLLFRSLLTLTSADMESFFQPCVASIIQLINGQVSQVERLHRRLKVPTRLMEKVLSAELIPFLENFPSWWFRGIRIFATINRIFSRPERHPVTEARYFVSHILRRSIISKEKRTNSTKGGPLLFVAPRFLASRSQLTTLFPQ